ncbi:hypothetical protein V9T40_013097 [Parthenolecanium corni]|uniref:Spondin-like TSP1 domain-containing protein n=1 Tax=Parthenolecanium corni TaxID=536013 RepID=A0AAN9Y6K7_9HEMI
MPRIITLQEAGGVVYDATQNFQTDYSKERYFEKPRIVSYDATWRRQAEAAAHSARRRVIYDHDQQQVASSSQLPAASSLFVRCVALRCAALRSIAALNLGSPLRSDPIFPTRPAQPRPTPSPPRPSRVASLFDSRLAASRSALTARFSIVDFRLSIVLKGRGGLEEKEEEKENEEKDDAANNRKRMNYLSRLAHALIWPNVVDCLVSVWQPWSACDVDCGAGMMWRRRTVLKQPLNGGKHCPSLIQKRGCLGTSCPQNPSSAFKEIATLLPIKAESKFVDDKEMRQNDVDSTFSGVLEPADKEYCVLYELVKVAKACGKERWFSTLKEGKPVRSLAVAHTYFQIGGDKVCVRCDKRAMRPSLGYRCAGHGTMDRTTRWTTLTAAHCHGKWMRLDSSAQTRPANSSPLCSACPAPPSFVFV